MKNGRRVMQAFLVTALSLSFVSFASAGDMKASLPLLPPLVESVDKGFLVDLVKAMDETYTEGDISISVYPFKRSLRNVVTGAADFHMPLLYNENISEKSMDFRLSTENVFQVIFVLYSNKNNTDINPRNLSQFKIETDRAHVDYFDIPVHPSDSIETSLKKVDMGRIDGFVFAMPETDGVLKKLGLKNIKRTMYGKFDVRAVLPKGDKGEKIDGILSAAIQELKANGKYDQIMGPIANQTFQEW